MKLRDRFGLASQAGAGRPRRRKEPARARQPDALDPGRPQLPGAEAAHPPRAARAHRPRQPRPRGPRSSANAELRAAIAQLIEEQAVPLSQRDREQLGEEILDEVHGLGPIEPLMRDPEVSDILVNTLTAGLRRARSASSSRRRSMFRDDAHLLQIIDRIVSRVGRRIDEIVADGRRAPARRLARQRHHPAARARRAACSRSAVSAATRCTVDDLVALGSLTPEHGRRAARHGAGAAEHAHLRRHRLRQDDAAQLPVVVHPRPASASSPSRTRPSCSCSSRTSCGWRRGPPTSRATARSRSATSCATALRMRPDRIIVGEVRGAEALDMLQAMNTGHDGSLSTIHANSPRDALSRLETMIQMAGFELPDRRPCASRSARRSTSSCRRRAWPTARAGSPSISEIVGMEGDTIMMQELFTFERDGVDSDGRIVGRFVVDGHPAALRRAAEGLEPRRSIPSVFDYLKA